MFNPATRKEGIIQFRIVNEDLTPLLGLRDSEELRLLELLQENIATLDCGKPDVPSSASELHTPLTMATILTNHPDVFDDSVGKLEGELHLYTKQDVTPSKAAPREIPLSVKKKFISEVKDLQEQGIIEKVTEPTDWVSTPTIVNKPSAKNGIRLCIDSRPLNMHSSAQSIQYQLLIICLLKLTTLKCLTWLISSLLSGISHWMNSVPCSQPSTLLLEE